MRVQIKKALLFIIPLILILFSLAWGSTGILSISELFGQIAALFQKEVLGQEIEIDQNMATILWQVRLPRILLTFMVGSALAVSGAVLQAIFRNPIVDPFSLGISSGAAFGAALSMLVSFFSITLSAFLFGVLAVGITYLVSYSKTRTTLITMVLSGMIISGVFTAFLTVLQYLSDPYKLQAIVQWTMGNLHTASWEKVKTSALPIVGGIMLIIIFRWRLNLLALGDEESMAVGVNPKGMKLLMVGLATMITAASVAAVGMISLFGLIVPHVTRIIFGPNNQIGVFANVSIGGTFLLLIDDLSRTLMPFEIPVGVFTMLLGAPLFIYLMRKNAVNWN
ncbi:FecCD family ABC transporter permease [Sphingobacterium daejeonense]|uniref:FecCD family ABC transporter permease n=1 Tax=Sphingobacterium daejeonense TaxID=371142 RepID=UPI0010C4C546|nr:iron ABC transporter permease [Sphingobacterium daejeonense]VTQ06662.1 Probable ABC transporter permease protein HI_1471 [Sphingobacterium daejeonense]